MKTFNFSNRPNVNECLNHKWLTADDDDDDSSVINLNVTIKTIPFDADAFLNFEEDKENSVKSLENGDKETTTIAAIVQHHSTKLRLEKSSSILFPDAPTTPKVSRKMLYDEEVCRKAPCDDNSNSFLIPVPST